ncbi:isoprenylcysteine carboxylmethyltransferase family protein [Methanonatronarchaeum sp. AMET6-2]|uniref:methyltransferase family protein n=1 Tax=Methanonatronarchaeum sp. AMET6-2 TaxID=2933293 RepID=UPI0012138786|nr:isoprenylcysteine carboxylmethyltransferase family protein [Methanonatronarchaeum sp. AMET6-2]RZN62568.1 MAG: isoprenylcysteine carboxylmethyltransferase family protein [Methanonatronarchaeia archaeon]UOY09371.1 isoprenylcysteine carboxylmethyltransferase family protein [Methanonatronarchaeum sp. AMET6-2]
MLDPTLNQLLSPTPQLALATILTITWLLEFKLYPSEIDTKPTRFKASYRSILLAITTSIIISITLTITQIHNLTGQTLTTTRNLGLLTMTIGLIIRYWSLHTLGKNFNRTVKVERKQRLICNGPYRKIRHPSYLGLILLATSVPIILGQPIGTLITLTLTTTTLKWRMDYEEKTMEQKIGSRYTEWKNKRYRLIPPIY